MRDIHSVVFTVILTIPALFVLTLFCPSANAIEVMTVHGPITLDIDDRGPCVVYPELVGPEHCGELQFLVDIHRSNLGANSDSYATYVVQTTNGMLEEYLVTAGVGGGLGIDPIDTFFGVGAPPGAEFVVETGSFGDCQGGVGVLTEPVLMQGIQTQHAMAALYGEAGWVMIVAKGPSVAVETLEQNVRAAVLSHGLICNPPPEPDRLQQIQFILLGIFGVFFGLWMLSKLYDKRRKRTSLDV